jgi:alpha-tubulin suppressor-like RCC1 family protein
MCAARNTTTRSLTRARPLRRELLCHGLRGDDTTARAGGPSGGSATVELLAWGGGYHGQLGVKLHSNKKSLNRGQVIDFPDGEEPRHVACGGSFSAVVTSSGRVYTWGMGKEGQLGYSLTAVSGQQPEPKLVDGLGSVQIMAIACGREHTLVLSFSGEMFSWGSNKYGQLGHGDHHNMATPRKLEVEKSGGGTLLFDQIATGDQHSASLSKGGNLYTWGNGVYGQLGHGELPRRGPDIVSPKLVERLRTIKCRSVSCGSSQTSVITTDSHQVYVCGAVEKYAAAESAAQRSITTCQFVYTPVLLDIKPEVQQVAGGKSHLLVLTRDGDVYTVGSGGSGQLGHGKRADLITPRLVLQGKKIFHVAAGRYHSVAITSHGSMFTWGSGEHGQLCHGVDEEETIPRVVDSLLHRALLKASCGEHHTIALCTAPIEDSDSQLSPDMVVWRFHEHEEYEMKHEQALKSPTGVTRKHLQKVQDMVRTLINTYEQITKQAVAVSEAELEPEAEDGSAPSQAVAPVASEEDTVVPLEVAKDNVMKKVLGSKDAFEQWQTFADSTHRTNERFAMFGGSAGTVEREMTKPETLKESSEHGGMPNVRSRAAKPASARTTSGSAPVSLPPLVSPKPSSQKHGRKPHPPPAEREPKGSSSSSSSGTDIPRNDMYVKLAQLQAAVRKSVNDVVKDDPSRGIEKMERELIAFRDVYSGMEAQRRLRAEETERLRTELQGLDGVTEQDDVKSLLQKADALKVQLQAVRLKYEEEKENREVFEIVIQQLHDELNVQSHRIGDLRTFQREHDLLLERMEARKDAALGQMIETQKEGRKVEAESKALRESLNEHLGGVRKLVQYMERTVSYVTKAAEDRHAKEDEKRKRKIVKLKLKLGDVEARRQKVRQCDQGAADALGTWLQKKFLAITEATGLGVGDVDKIVVRIASRDEVMEDLENSQAVKKRELMELSAAKKKAEQDLIDIRAQFMSERTLQRVDKTRDKLDIASAKTAKPMDQWLKSTATLASFHQLAMTLIQKVDYVTHAGGPDVQPYKTSLDDISLWKPTGMKSENAVFFLNLLAELAQRLELLNKVPDTV